MGVLFDLDNTLTNRAESIYLFTQHFMEDFHSHLHHSISFEEVHRVMVQGDGGGYRPKEKMFDEIQNMLRWAVKPEIAVIAEYWYTVSPFCMQLRRGVRRTLTELLHRGYRLGLITNGNTHVQNATIEAVEIRDYFEIILISEEVGLCKPDPRIFQLAAANMQLSPYDCIYVGDHPHADIEGARSAGFKTIWFAGIHAWTSELLPPDAEITAFPQLLDIFA